tara:strand:+ start:569 stop:1009 length:441 start_codon:yes stop_codon:yes gene_type:complete
MRISAFRFLGLIVARYRYDGQVLSTVGLPHNSLRPIPKSLFAVSCGTLARVAARHRRPAEIGPVLNVAGHVGPIVLTDADCGLVATGPSSKSTNSVRASRSVSKSQKGKAAARVVAGAAAQKLVPFSSKPIATVKPKKKTNNLKKN